MIALNFERVDVDEYCAAHAGRFYEIRVKPGARFKPFVRDEGGVLLFTRPACALDQAIRFLLDLAEGPEARP